MDLMARRVPGHAEDFKIDPSERIVTGEERKKKAEEFAGRKKDLILRGKRGPWPRINAERNVRPWLILSSAGVTRSITWSRWGWVGQTPSTTSHH